MKTVPTQNRSSCETCTAGRSGSLIKAVKILAAAFILISTFIWKIPAGARLYSYWTAREILKAYSAAGTWNMDKITSEHFYVKFRPEDRDSAELVLETAELFYEPVTSDFGYAPRGRVPIILYSSKEDLNRSFGWEAKESAIGVYYAGAIRVLTPRSWIDETGPGSVRETFISSGPMAHEFTHLMVDYLAGGNYPRWFTEGLAQYEEYKLTGFEFNEPAGSVKGSLYSMKDITENFDDLPNQSLAYREAFSAVRYIAGVHGEKTLYDIIDSLGEGMEFENAIQKHLELDYTGFEKCWREWALG